MMILTRPDTQILHTLMLDFSMTPESHHLQVRPSCARDVWAQPGECERFLRQPLHQAPWASRFVSKVRRRGDGALP